MTTHDDTRKVVEGYFSAWTRNDVDSAFALFAPDLIFVGPTASYDSAEAFRPALINFAAMTKAARIVELLIDGDRAAMLYDCELPPPVGMLKIASFFRVANGKNSNLRNSIRCDRASKAGCQEVTAHNQRPS